MPAVDRFTISSPTQIIFGDGTFADLAKTLPPRARKVVLVTGASGVASAPVSEVLRRSDVSLYRVRCTGEPSVPSINAALDMLAGSRPDVVVACGGGSVMDTGKLLAFLLSHDLPLQDEFEKFDGALLAGPAPIPCIALPKTARTRAEVTANAGFSCHPRVPRSAFGGAHSIRRWRSSTRA